MTGYCPDCGNTLCVCPLPALDEEPVEIEPTYWEMKAENQRKRLAQLERSVESLRQENRSLRGQLGLLDPNTAGKTVRRNHLKMRSELRRQEKVIKAAVAKNEAMRNVLEILGQSVGFKHDLGWWVRRDWVRDVIAPFVSDETRAAWR